MTAAKEALKKAKGPVLEELMPEFKINKSGQNKKSRELEDIRKALVVLREKNQMLLILATANQILKCPQSWGVPESPTSQDLMGKIMHLEKALGDSIELQKDLMNKIKEEIVSIETSGSRANPVPGVILTQDTPNTKKRKLDEHQQTQQHHTQYQQQQQQPEQQSYANVARGVYSTTNLAGISPLSQGTGGKHHHQGIRLLQNILQMSHQQSGKNSRNLCVGSAKANNSGGDDTKLSGDVSLVATGVAKDCTEDDLKQYLAGKGIETVDVERLTKPEVMDMVRTVTFRVAIKAVDYDAALKPEVWPYRVGVRHYRAPRRPALGSGWRGQSSQSGGTINSGTLGGATNSYQNHKYPAGGTLHLPPGHPGRVGPEQQLMSPGQKTPIEVSNFWNILNTLASTGGDSAILSQP